ncbi:MAG TPA: tyrosine--tRNA ligase [Candidatus Magasanikbacteria bacterium]|mgnify:FL=1|nr:tyrosine--tRNA ligase [Candidatus Magasanikbacteria bacterium]
MKINNDPKKNKEVLERSVDTLYPDRKAFEEALNSGRQLRIYMGIDPTATYAHLGHATNYIILKRLHELGHKIIVLIGDFTAMIGDPSDKNAARKRLTREDVENNMKTFREQIGKILDFNNAENPIEFRYNSEWLSKLTFTDSVELASHFTVQRMLERDNFHKRIQENKPLYVHEFFYPLMQGYDSVALEADIEIGGTDQTFNMLAGRTLVRAYQNREKLVMTTTLLENPVTGEKLMSKSLGTGIGLDEAPNDMFGKTMALPDEAIVQVFIDCTYKTTEEIAEIRESLKNGANPRDLKIQLAKEIVKIYHNEKAADEAEEYFINTFKKKEMPTDMLEIMPTVYELAVALLEGGLVKSKSLARQVIDQGGVKLNGEKVGEGEYTKQLKSGDVIQKGARFFVRIK